jgi:hypothetical protein
LERKKNIKWDLQEASDFGARKVVFNKKERDQILPNPSSLDKVTWYLKKS